MNKVLKVTFAATALMSFFTGYYSFKQYESEDLAFTDVLQENISALADGSKTNKALKRTVGQELFVTKVSASASGKIEIGWHSSKVGAELHGDVTMEYFDAFKEECFDVQRANALCKEDLPWTRCASTGCPKAGEFR